MDDPFCWQRNVGRKDPRKEEKGSGRRGRRRERERKKRVDRRGQSKDPLFLMWGLFSLVPTEVRVVTPQPAKTRALASEGVGVTSFLQLGKGCKKIGQIALRLCF